jgi:hypothetical protein
MSAIHSRKLKIIEFGLDEGEDEKEFQCQISNWVIENNTDDGERFFTFCPDGEDREDADDDYALALTFFSDWRENGISDFLVEHNKELLPFRLEHHPDIPEEHVVWTGTVKIKAPNVGGDVRETESQEVTLPIIGLPVYSRGSS